MTTTNTQGLWTYGFDLKVDSRSVFSEACGTPISGGSVGCRNDYTLGVVFDHTVTVQGRQSQPQVALLHDAIGIAVGGSSACAIRDGGSVVCWGDNTYGQLGNGSTVASHVPVAVTGVTNATSASCSQTSLVTNAVQTFQCCVVLANGAVNCWGGNTYGQLGNDSTKNSSQPSAVTGIENALGVSAGSFHTCAVLKDGHVACWGDNTYGELGNGSTTSSLIPVMVSGIQDATMVSAGNSADQAYTCAISSGGAVSCWGGGGSTVPVAAAGVMGVTSIATENAHICLSLSDGTVHCSGANNAGQLGNGSTTNSSTAVQAIGIDNASSVVNYYGGSCALLRDGTAKCWGNNAFGALGNGTDIASLVPVSVRGLKGVKALSSGFPVCALLDGGEVDCWGDNFSGDLGNDSTSIFLAPERVHAPE